jgi:hypothetical protein
MHGAITPLPQYALWRGTQFKKSKGTTLPLPLPYGATNLYQKNSASMPTTQEKQQRTRLRNI